MARKNSQARQAACRICGKDWQISALAVIPPSGYVCPVCETKQRNQKPPTPSSGRQRIRQNRKQRNQSRIWSRKLTEMKILRVKKQKSQSTATK